MASRCRPACVLRHAAQQGRGDRRRHCCGCLNPNPRSAPSPASTVSSGPWPRTTASNAIAIVLSGTGTDGSRGIRDIKAAGGGTYIQSMASSKYDGMPRAARQTGTVDHELSPEDIAARLHKLDELAGHLPEPSAPDSRQRPPPAPATILSIRSSASLQARGEGRLHALQALHAPAPHRAARGGHALPQLRGVRAAAGRQPRGSPAAVPGHPDLGHRVLPRRAVVQDAGRPPAGANQAQARQRRGQPFRIWVVGCATGEEAYSLAILAHEAMERAHRSLHLQIFATDLDEQAMATARKGCLSAQQPRRRGTGAACEILRDRGQRDWCA